MLKKKKEERRKKKEEDLEFALIDRRALRVAPVKSYNFFLLLMCFISVLDDDRILRAFQDINVINARQVRQRHSVDLPENGYLQHEKSRATSTTKFCARTVALILVLARFF